MLPSKTQTRFSSPVHHVPPLLRRTSTRYLSDGWNDRCRRTLINFLAYFSKETVFTKSIEASSNVVNYVAAGKLLKNEFPKL
ncbi:unnamed protein product [Lathyrus oleraceus]